MRVEIAGRIGKILQSDSYAAFPELKAVRLRMTVCVFVCVVAGSNVSA